VYKPWMGERIELGRCLRQVDAGRGTLLRMQTSAIKWISRVLFIPLNWLNCLLWPIC
jgi:hypothetical protein